MNNYFMGQDGFSWFIGVVEDRNDPEKAGRVRVRCLGYHSTKTEDIPLESLPWASIMMPVTAGGNSGIGTSSHFLIEGTWVVGFFRDPAKQEPVIMGALPGVNTSKKSNFTIASSSAVGGYSEGGGFKDPKGVYPTTKYVGKPDTNLLAQELVSEHASHNATAPEGSLEGKLKYYENWTTASGTATQPKTTQDKAKYPTNHVFETESGHYVEFDDTAGNERIHLYHKQGTFIEIDSSGNVIIKTVGNVTNIVAGNMDTYVKGNYSVSCGGTMDIYSAGLVTELFAKGRKTTISAEGDTVTITGDVKADITGKLTETVSMDVKQDYTLNLTTTIGVLGSIKASGAMTVGGSSISFN